MKTKKEIKKVLYINKDLHEKVRRISVITGQKMTKVVENAVYNYLLKKENIEMLSKFDTVFTIKKEENDDLISDEKEDSAIEPEEKF